MKRVMIFTLMFLAIMFTAPAWSHHPAEGIVSDDIWQMVNDNLVEAGSPHLTIDMSDIMDSMGTVDVPSSGNDCSGNADCGGRVLLVTSIIVEPTDFQTYMDAIEDVTINRLPAGNMTSDKAFAFEIVTEDLIDGRIMISIFEPVGSGESQDDLTPKKGN